MSENNILRNKKTDMSFAALLILIFHLWIFVARGSVIENFIVKTGYIGVDMFLLLSAYSLTSRPLLDIKKYYLSRLPIYLKFVGFTIAASLINKWGLLRCIRIITGIELFQKGGGSFLWFLPAIVIVYLVFPLLNKIFKFKPWINTSIILSLWFFVGIMVTKYSAYTGMFIFWNRIPIMLVGYLLAKYGDRILKIGTGVRALISVLLFFAGIILVWKFGYRLRLDAPIKDMYYVAAVPMVTGLTMLIDLIPENIVTKVLGNATLEAYAIQMIWGVKLASFFYKFFKAAILSNLVTIICIFGLSVCLNFAIKELFYIRRAK